MIFPNTPPSRARFPRFGALAILAFAVCGLARAQRGGEVYIPPDARRTPAYAAPAPRGPAAAPSPGVSSGGVPSFGPNAALQGILNPSGAGYTERPKNEDDAFERSPDARRPIRDMTSEPWLSPQGERLAAVVDDRYLTKPELDSRTAIALQNAPPITALDPREKQRMEQDRWIGVAQEIMEEWVVTTTLALEAQRIGIGVSPREIDDTLAKLARDQGGDPSQVASRVRMVGLSEDLIRQEVADGLLVEKFVMDVVRNYDRSYYKQVFDAEPATFLIPPRVRAFHVYKHYDGSMTARRRKEIEAELARIRKELAKKTPDYDDLAKLSDPGSGLAVGDMGWIQADAPLLPEMHRALFSLSPGETSEIFRAGLGLHIVKVTEREEGSGMSFEAAIPQIENYLFGRTKRPLYESIRGRYEIRMNSGGLNRWREVGTGRVASSPPRPAAPAASAPAPAPPERKPAAAPPASPPPARPKPAQAPAIDLTLLPE